MADINSKQFAFTRLDGSRFRCQIALVNWVKGQDENRLLGSIVIHKGDKF
jgi:hypothetical protein